MVQGYIDYALVWYVLQCASISTYGLPIQGGTVGYVPWYRAWYKMVILWYGQLSILDHSDPCKEKEKKKKSKSLSSFYGLTFVIKLFYYLVIEINFRQADILLHRDETWLAPIFWSPNLCPSSLSFICEGDYIYI